MSSLSSDYTAPPSSPPSNQLSGDVSVFGPPAPDGSLDAFPSWDVQLPPNLGQEALPEYTRKDPERIRRESISQALWDQHREREAAMARAFEEDRLERQRSRQRPPPQNIFDRWIQWSAKFYMPLMTQWGDKHRKP